MFPIQQTQLLFPKSMVPRRRQTTSQSVPDQVCSIVQRSSQVGVQEALRRTASVGGPFCNLLGLLVARMEVEDFSKAVEVTRAHLPDPADVEANLFLRDIYDFFANNRPVLSSMQGLQESVHRSEERRVGKEATSR